MRIFRIAFLISLSGLLLFSFAAPQAIRTISMKVTSKVLNNGRYVSTTGTLGYTASGGTMITHFDAPVESWFFLNAKGELKIYNPGTNEVMIEPNTGATSQASYMYYFLSGQTGDMGLRAMGFTVSDTRFDDGMVITTWMPPSVMAGLMGKAELVHENYRPVYAGWFDLKGECVLKTYYSNFTMAGGLPFPQSVTEIRFKSPADSTIEKKIYSDFRVNDAADTELFSFRIPDNAKINAQ
jgi:hypothetical protein